MPNKRQLCFLSLVFLPSTNSAVISTILLDVDYLTFYNAHGVVSER